MTIKIILAPMEGVADHHIRELLTSVGGIDQCVTEFVRVTHTKLPTRVFTQSMPELNNHCQTRNGVPVKLQLLGSNPEVMALNANKAIKHGANAIDLNFGCPAKTVNNSDGGAKLLKEPNRVYNIVKAVRDAVPANIPVTAKMRLGYEDKHNCIDNAQAMDSAGANELAVHARTKVEGYKPPAHWEYITEIKNAVSIPVIANGDIWNLEDFKRCQQITGCQQFMIGRGLMACPDLALQIKAYLNNQQYTPMTWRQICPLLEQFYLDTLHHYPLKFNGNRLKQWLAYLKTHYQEANHFFETIKRLKTPEDILKAFANDQSKKETNS